MEILSVKDLKFKYPSSESYAVDGASFSLQRGEFAVICGVSGCGKTTLLRSLKREISPFGEQHGEILLDGKDISDLDALSAASRIGFVMQDPDSQIVTDTVWHELAFGLENLGVPRGEIRRRVAEMASYFGINNWFRQSTDSLSGGQKQLLNLASVMVMQPDILLLDEPTGRLDPIAADEFVSTVQKLRSELGLTVIMVEHRLDSILPFASRVLVMQDGRIISDAPPHCISDSLRAVDPLHPMLAAMPAAVRIFSSLGGEGTCPLTVGECRAFLQGRQAVSSTAAAPRAVASAPKTAVSVKDVYFRYGRQGNDVLRGVSLDVRENEIYCILGGNGAGKSTLLSVIAGINHSYGGKVLINGKPLKAYGASLYRGCLAFLPQEPQTLFVRQTVSDDLSDTLSAQGVSDIEAKEKISRVSERLGIQHLLSKHPFDISGGELQKCAIAKILLAEPRTLLLDEPTKGIDAFAKRSLGRLIKSLASDGITVLLVTHDMDFAAEYCDRCALLFDGEIVSEDEPQAFFSHNRFYTTEASRITHGLPRSAVTCDSVISLYKEGDAR